MAKKKHKKKEVEKRRARTKSKKQKKYKLKVFETANPDNVTYIERPSFSDIEAPEGFRPISASQAMMEYAKPLMDRREHQDNDDLNVSMNLSMLIWNYSIQLEGGKEDKKVKKKILGVIKSLYYMSDAEAVEFLEYMIKRKEHLLPKEIQPKYAMTMFIRKEQTYKIAKFDYRKLDLSKSPIITNEKASEIVSLINRMDRFILEESEYEEWEDHYFEMERKCSEGFSNWLISKGYEEYSNDFSMYTEVFINCLYRYGHNDVVTLKSANEDLLEEFFFDHLLRKFLTEPTEYTAVPAAIKSFYQFLQEIGYIKDHTMIKNLIDNIEPQFLKLLRKNFG